LRAAVGVASVISVIAIGLAILYIGWLVMLWRFQERIVFQPPAPPDFALPPWARRVTYAASDGQPLLGYVVGPARDERANGAEHGAAGYLVKPVGRESLLSVLAGIGALAPASVTTGNNERREAP